MKLLSKAYDIINILEGVGEVPPGIPSVGNVSYYSSVDEASEGEWGNWYKDKDLDCWSIKNSQIDETSPKDPWGRKLSIDLFEEMKDNHGFVMYWKGNFKTPQGNETTLVIWNNNG